MNRHGYICVKFTMNSFKTFQMVRVRVDTASALEFGPLFDGALVTMSELSQLVRLTVVRFWKSLSSVDENFIISRSVLPVLIVWLVSNTLVHFAIEKKFFVMKL